MEWVLCFSAAWGTFSLLRSSWFKFLPIAKWLLFPPLGILQCIAFSPLCYKPVIFCDCGSICTLWTDQIVLMFLWLQEDWAWLPRWTWQQSAPWNSGYSITLEIWLLSCYSNHLRIWTWNNHLWMQKTMAQAENLWGWPPPCASF